MDQWGVSVLLDRQPVPAIRPGTSDFAGAVQEAVRYSLGKPWEQASPADILHACSLATRRLLIDRMLATEKRFQRTGAKRVYYLSLEYLVGHSLGNNLINLGLMEQAESALTRLGVKSEPVLASAATAVVIGTPAACSLGLARSVRRHDDDRT